MNLPKKKARIFSSDSSRARSRAVVFNYNNFFNGDSANDDFDFNEPIAPVSSQASQNVVARTRKAHQCHESGESNQVDTDIEYFIESLDRDKNKTDIRCLSLLGLAKKVMSIEYRMHLRAHDDMPRIITKLIDAPQDPSLALSCATLLFIHNQDTTDIDPVALKLMLELINGGDSVHKTDKVEKKHKDAVFEMINQMRESGHAKNLDTEKITAATLATETLLGLNPKRAGDWFNEEIRELKGIDFIVETVASIAQTEDLDEDDALLTRLDRCMHLLESITTQNRCNQEYMVNYKDGILIDSCLELMTICKKQIAIAINDAQLKLFTTALLMTLKVLNNITSENRTSSVIGDRFEITELILYFINELQDFLKPEQRSDVTMICLCLLINMVEFSHKLREHLMRERRINNLIDRFYERIKDAQQTEQQADQLLDSHKGETMTEAMQDSLIHQVIAKSGKHMEHSVIAACLAILFGCIIQDHPRYREQLISNLHENSVAPLVDVIQKLLVVADLAHIMTKTGVDRVKRILKVLK